MKSEKPPNMTELNSRTIENAIEAQKATHRDGKCSLCDKETPVGNFCEKCGATFLTERQIEQWRARNPSAAKEIDSRQAQKAKIFKI